MSWLGAAIVFTFVAYFGVLHLLLRRGWIVGAGVAALIVSVVPLFADRDGGDGAYGVAILVMALWIFPLALIVAGTLRGVVAGLKRLWRIGTH